jgi:hypothetical protein
VQRLDVLVAYPCRRPRRAVGDQPDPIERRALRLPFLAFEREIAAGGTVTISTFTGGITNSGTIKAATGIAIQNVTIAGGIADSGIISATHGIVIGALAAVTASHTAISISGPTFTGGISNAGAIAGVTGLVVTAGVQTFTAAIASSGTISGSGGIAIDVSAANNAMTINQSAGLISGTIKLSANADIFNISGGTVAGNIVGSGALDTINFAPGAGNTFSYGNTFTTINQVNISSGTVLLNGSGTDVAANIDVLSGATLGGTGTLGSIPLPTAMTVHTGGTFAPGVPGTVMQVTGSLTLQSAAIYMVSIDGVNVSGANVTGTVSIASGSSGAVFKVAGGSTPVVNTDYLVLTASSITGTFSNSTVLFGGYEGRLDYSHADEVFLDVSFGTIAPLLPPGAPQNVINVANAIDSAITGGATLPANFQTLFSYTPTDTRLPRSRPR